LRNEETAMNARAPALMWFRRDLRLADNAALAAAGAGGRAGCDARLKPLALRARLGETRRDRT